MQGHVQAELLLDDCYQDIAADGDPDLCPHSVLGSAVEAFYAQVLLDPLEEQFHLPSAPVQGANGQRRQRKLVGQEHQVLAGLGIAIADAAQVAGVVLGGIEAVKADGLVADKPRVAIHRRRVHAPCIEVLLGARDEESSGLIQRVEPLEVQVTPIHDVEGTGLDEQKVQYIDVVHLAVRDMDECGDRSPQIEQRVQLHGRFGGAKRRPREHRQAQIDGRSIEGIHGIGQFHAEALVDVERTGLDDQPLSQLEVDAPVARFVGISQRRASDRRADAHVVKLAGLSRQTHFDIAQAFAVGQLREGHDAKLLGATKAARPVIAAVTIDDPMEGLPRQEVHDLREQRLAEVHGDSGVEKPGTLAQTAISNSSRRHPLSSEKPRRYWLSHQYLSS